MSFATSTPKKKVSDTVSFIKTTNPEVFRIEPRPGGVIPIKANDFKTCIQTGDISPESQQKIEEHISREFRVQTALDEIESVGSEDVSFPNPLKDSMYVMCVTISTLMLMAADHPDIPEDYLRWTTQCLENIKDDFGNHPPNVQGILNYMKKLNGENGTLEQRKGNVETTEDPEKEGEYEGEQTVKTSTVVHMGGKSAEE